MPPFGRQEIRIESEGDGLPGFSLNPPSAITYPDGEDIHRMTFTLAQAAGSGWQHSLGGDGVITQRHMDGQSVGLLLPDYAVKHYSGPSGPLPHRCPALTQEFRIR